MAPRQGQALGQGPGAGGRDALRPKPLGACPDRRSPSHACTGIYTVAWELPLDPQAVQDVQREQAKLQAELRRGSKGAGFAAQHVGARLSVFWEAEDEWYPGCILDVDTR